ncbi:MAG TPA: hypothetical protein VHI93_08990, partial [Candidatus Thermoplasmatota archaeon]|nr:hypothetical protein [Candidatus Thermoplasmatota archaeon]
HAMEFHQGVRPGQAVIGDEPERWLPEGLGRLLRDATDSLENLLPDGLEGLDRLVPSRLVDERRQDPDLVQ